MREMKDSGIEWIGEIPANWDICPLKSKFSFGKGLAITKKDLSETGIGVISYGQIHAKENRGTAIDDSLIRHVSEEYLETGTASLVKQGDFIFADTSEDYDGCGNCVYVDRDEPLFAGYHTIILRPKHNTANKYLAYLFATDAWRSQIRSNAMGVKVFSITQRMIRDVSLFIPPEAEQEKIVDFLDAKCADIDALIAAKERSNELLREQRQSIIYEAVTKGLDPNVPMKDSGVAWIGDIPETWDTAKIKYTGFYQSGDPIGADQIAPDGLYPIYGGNGIRGYTSNCNQTGPHVLIGRQGALCGNVHFVEGKFWASEHAVVGTISPSYEDKFVFYVLTAFDLNRLSVTAAQPGISVTQIVNVLIPVPPSKETQRGISEYLDSSCQKIDSIIETNGITIQKLREYRQSIIYEAVTGKIEV